MCIGKRAWAWAWAWAWTVTLRFMIDDTCIMALDRLSALVLLHYGLGGGLKLSEDSMAYG
jgi:hypothetical protein